MEGVIGSGHHDHLMAFCVTSDHPWHKRCWHQALQLIRCLLIGAAHDRTQYRAHTRLALEPEHRVPRYAVRAPPAWPIARKPNSCLEIEA